MLAAATGTEATATDDSDSSAEGSSVGVAELSADELRAVAAEAETATKICLRASRLNSVLFRLCFVVPKVLHKPTASYLWRYKLSCLHCFKPCCRQKL
jgi:hypothetical protein